ncbi:hypothetical protein [Dictyobacter kobayashii]|uniref:hypothetical protein n=1 Tax=Dictyobacter kobayashii TaxID=2014872 RepID=UPI000F845ED9|nr:hypothetical protein [Dictyobacter kobayashii]
MKSQHTRKISLRRADDIPASQTCRAASPLPPPPRSRPGHLSSTLHALESHDAYGLEIVLERLQRCLVGRISVSELEVLHFCLRQLFENTDLLYALLLSDLYHQVDLLALSIDPCPDEAADSVGFGLKIVLQNIEAILERLVPLAQLLLSSTHNTLESLDRSCSLYGPLVSNDAYSARVKTKNVQRCWPLLRSLIFQTVHIINGCRLSGC